MTARFIRVTITIIRGHITITRHTIIIRHRTTAADINRNRHRITAAEDIIAAVRTTVADIPHLRAGIINKNVIICLKIA